VAQPPVERARDAIQEAWENPRLTFRRLSGLDRSGPPPPQTLAGAPLNPWTIPNAIGIVRLALIPVFMALALGSEDGTDTAAVIIFAVVAWSDYADGIAARVTGQYSRFGALLDPVVDRLLVAGGVVVVWKFDLLPRWALAVLLARELFLLLAGRAALRRGVELKVNWWGRLAVWPTMSALFFALAGGVETLAEVLLYVGVGMSLVAAWLYVAEARRQVRSARGVAPSSGA